MDNDGKYKHKPFLFNGAGCLAFLELVEVTAVNPNPIKNELLIKFVTFMFDFIETCFVLSMMVINRLK